jgi:hypothetical protein
MLQNLLAGHRAPPVTIQLLAGVELSLILRQPAASLAEAVLLHKAPAAVANAVRVDADGHTTRFSLKRLIVQRRVRPRSRSTLVRQSRT